MIYNAYIIANLFRTTKFKVTGGDLCLGTAGKDCLFAQYLMPGYNSCQGSSFSKSFFNNTDFIAVICFGRLDKSTCFEYL